MNEEKFIEECKPTKEMVNTLLQKAKPEKPWIAIDAVSIGEHVPESVADDICNWLTACIHNDISPQTFSKIWEKLWNEGEITACFGITGEDIEDPDTFYWEDVLEGDTFDIDELYEKTAKQNGDRFVWLDDNAFVSIISLRGDVGASAIETCVIDYTNIIVTAGETQWPEELGIGSRIKSLEVAISPSGKANLRDGSNVVVDCCVCKHY